MGVHYEMVCVTHFSNAWGESLTKRVKLEHYCQILSNDTAASPGVLSGEWLGGKPRSSATT